MHSPPPQSQQEQTSCKYIIAWAFTPYKRKETKVNKTKFNLEDFQANLECAVKNLRLVFCEIGSIIPKEQSLDALYADITLLDMLSEKLSVALEGGEVK